MSTRSPRPDGFEEIRESLRLAVLDRRIALCLNQSEFGKLVGAHPSLVSNVETTGRNSSSGSPVSTDRLISMLLSTGLTRADIARIIGG